jgi:hypothetical protein
MWRARSVAEVTKALFVILALGVSLAGCAPLIAGYSAEAYKNATTLKAEALAMIDKSGESYASRQKEVDALSVKIDAAYEYAAGLPNNEVSARQWLILKDPDRSFYGGYIRLWKSSGAVKSAAFRADAKQQVGRAFDEIICLEVNKQSLKACSKVAAEPGKKAEEKEAGDREESP